MTCNTCNCTIFKRPIFSDAKINDLTIDVSWLKNLIPPYDPSLSGIWMPISINSSQSSIEYVDILSRAKSEQNFFDPCNCDPSSEEKDDQDESQELSCAYCSTDILNNYSIGGWSLVDTANGQSKQITNTTCCEGACDVRITKDDYLTKLPVLNSSYLTKFHDWKYKKQFPACSNKGLGKEKFIYGKNFETFTSTNAELVIDWKIKERISEIPPNDVDSYHDTLDDHEKSYKRSLITSKTCGNFILTKLGSEYTNNPTYPLFSGLISDIAITGNYSKLLPKPSAFTEPYGFKNQDYSNIFIKTEKVGSYWKWNYTSGILCWYRYFDIDNKSDDRLIKKVDLYISEGDVFYAKNDGPENSSSSHNSINGLVHNCPSGLKLIKNNTVTGILPNNSEFIYISQNLYAKFYNILDRLEGLEVELDVPSSTKMKPIKKLELAALLATGPNYDGVTVDLLKTIKDLDDPEQDYKRDKLNYIKVFNSGMLSKPQFKLNKLNIVKTKEDLINTLADKYGPYVWFPPNSTSKLEFNTSSPIHSYIDLDFEPVVKDSDTTFSRDCQTSPSDCADGVVVKTFAYDQIIQAGNFTFSTTVDKKYKSLVCNSGVFKIDKAANTISAYFNNSLIKEAYYGSGCSRFYQKYLRPLSYDLALKKIGENLCKDENFCNETLAKKYDKTTAGVFDDKSLILDRQYPANYCHVNVDRIGFNKQGGIYYDSNVFGSGNIVFKSSLSSSDGKHSISFKTKDIGIKLYSLEIHKLRDEKHSQCKTFPINKPCQCFPLSYIEGFRYNCDGSLTFSNTNNILYTPNLSTQFSPKIKSYGGYTRDQVDEILGEGNRVDNHPSVGSDLTTVNRIIDPINPYGCEESIEISFPNYVYTKWSAALPNQYNTSHADIWMKVNENVDLFRQFLVVEEDGEPITKPNANYRRYTTKVEVNNKIIYGNQQDILFDKDTTPSLITMELTSPFLYTLLSQLAEDIDKNKILYTPLPCSLDVNTSFENPFDAYLVKYLGLIIKRLPRKQILAYKFKPLVKIGNLKKSFFHPNSGLVSDSSFFGKTSLTFNSGNCSFDFDYERKIFNNANASAYSDSGIMYSGNITSQVKRILESVDNLLNHKKLRLYLKYENTWYEYTNPNIFGYYNEINNNQYPGHPLFFEYAKEDKYKTQLLINKYVDNNLNTNKILITEPSPLVPISAKENISFSYSHNAINSGNLSILPNNNYPLFNEIFFLDKDSNNKVIIPGTRPYFLIEEEDPAIPISKIDNIDQETQDKIFRNVFLVDEDDQRWRYKGEGSKTDKNSYELVLPRNYRDHNFSEGFINYTNSNKKGYIGNTSVPTKPIEIELIDISNSKNRFKGKIKSKSIRAPKSDKYGNEIPIFNALKPSEYLKTFTILELDICSSCKIPIKEGYVKLVNPTGEAVGSESFVIYRDFSQLLKLEKDYLLSNNQTRTKWGDLINFDNNIFTDINNSNFLYQAVERYYPETPYNNILYGISLNNLETGNFKAMIFSKGSGNRSEKSGVFDYSGLIYYNIHQIYNIGLNKYAENIINNYQNYLPFIDINFLDSAEVKKQSWYSNLKENYKKNIPSTGQIYISGIRSCVDTSILPIKPESGSIFFISLDKDQYLQPVLFDKDFYYDSLRVDDVYYRLASLSKEESYNSSGCRSVFRPNISFSNQTFAEYFNTNGFCPTPISGHYYENLPIYCDIDKVSQCNNDGCGLKVAGWTKLRAGYNHYEYPFITVKKIESQDNIEYALSVDEGLYNIVGNNSIPYIQRFELQPKSNLFPNTTLDGSTNCVKGNDPRPNRPQSYIDYEFQTKLKEYILGEGSKGDLVKNTDILANEMLFRLIYGSKQQINYDNIKKKTIVESIKYQRESSLSYLLQYTNPKTTPDLIYKLIPYDYATNSDQSKRKITGTINIDGVLKVGKTVSVKIGGSTLSITIQKIDGKIYAVAQCGGVTAKGMIHDEDGISISTFSLPANQNPSPPDANTTYRVLATCEIPDSYAWSKGSYFSAMSYSNGEKEIDVVGEYKRCLNKVMEENKCVNRIDWGGAYPDASVLDSGFVDCIGTPPCVGCLGRGYSDGVTLSDNCSIISQRSSDVSIGGYSRGLFGVGNVFSDCPPRQNPFISTSPCQLAGDFDAFIGGTVVMQHFGRTNCSTQQPSCRGTCVPLDYSDKWGEVNNPRRFSTTNDSYPICECSTYNYGYCAIPDNNCSCHKYYPGFPKIFTYNFEYCNYTLNMRGNLWKLADGDPPQWRDVPRLVPCVTEEYSSAEGSAGSATEVCYWIECRTDAQDIKIWESKTRSPNPYNPLCPSNLCSISYDNNTITLNLQSVVQCFPNVIRSDCPEISITLPDNTFTFTDSINSECTECSVEKNAILQPKSQNPQWDIITETRTAVIAWTLPIEGDRNIDVMGGGGAVYVDKSICGDTQPCCCDNCYSGAGAIKQCGQSAPSSWPWLHGFACHLNGSPDPEFTQCKRRTSTSALTNLRGGLGFYVGSDNGAVKARVIADWKNQVRAIYKTYAPCFNHQDGSIIVNDLVEGVVPGSCSELQFAVASYPIVAWRNNLDGGEMQDGSLGVHYAYFTYEYRRPRTIQDVFLGENASKCATVLPISPTNGYNITEKYEIKNCQTVPTCSDIKPEICDDNNYCCKHGR